MSGHETYLFAGGRTTILVDGAATGGRFAVLRDTQPPGNSTPPHWHESDWETVCVIDGAIQVETRGSHTKLSAGAAVALPAGDVHRLANAGNGNATILIVCVPAGFENFVRGVGERVTDPDAAMRPMTHAERQALTALAPSFGVRLDLS